MVVPDALQKSMLGKRKKNPSKIIYMFILVWGLTLYNSLNTY